jgi:hypothetical protein
LPVSGCVVGYKLLVERRGNPENPSTGRKPINLEYVPCKAYGQSRVNGAASIRRL